MNVELRNFTYITALVLMLGWLLHIGKAVLLPVMLAMIALYIVTSAASRLQRVPLMGRLSAPLRRALVLLLFAAIVGLVITYLVSTLSQVASVLPRYESNLNALVTRTARILGVDDEPTWETIRDATLGQISLQQWVTPVIYSVQGLSGMLFLVVLYSFFFMAERGRMASKLLLALNDQEKGKRALAILARINARVGEYLSVKTVVNIILGVLCFVIMYLFGLEFALFWAILIGLLNYIPYIGSMIGVIFPVLLSLAQFGSFGWAGALAILLTTAQIGVASYLEPMMMSRAFNLSPFVVLLALAFWSALWGLSGAMLAVPLTATLIIVLAEIPPTRPVAIMLSANGKV
ncbi:AI-2E family transporter [Pseudooceanicola sp. 502str34]|uniref:AI-2E family transporter n=1 Tax=Maritimibacter alkaliphilus TaxID=404236 RepID=UPI001C96F937|nr:AI-2E family transporter [Maritimibacter alkaliphilus]MBY6092107.1 AI-2E family transporter [Maritimibacter alkaliphilus]